MANQRVLSATPYAINAIRKAANLPRNMLPAPGQRRPVYMPSKAAGYNGYFKVTNTSEDESLSVSVALGKCRINIAGFTVVETAVSITDSGYVYLQSQKYEDGTIDPPQILFAEYEDDSENPPAVVEGYCKEPLAQIIVNEDGDAIENIIQTQYGFLKTFIFGECIS